MNETLERYINVTVYKALPFNRSILRNSL